MKNQYFGDINDYIKYGLLRILSNHGALKIGVCWMLTPDDGRNDGQIVQYLNEPDQWSKYDPTLFDLLKRAVQIDRVRDVQRAESSAIISSAQFYTPFIRDNAEVRKIYVDTMLQQFAGVDLIFFDPDKGLEVPSSPLGNRDSSMYLYFAEAGEAFARGHSLLIYQHFAHVKHALFINQKAAQLRAHTGADEIYAFQTPYVVFLLAVQRKHALQLSQSIDQVKHTWKEQITTYGV